MPGYIAQRRWKACDLVPTMIQQLCHFSFESTSFDSCQPSSSVLSECSTCLYRKALLPFSHTAVGAYLSYRSGNQPCSRSLSWFPCLENTRAGSLMQGKKVHPHAAVLAVLVTPHYFWPFHLPCAAWSLMYSTRIYHVGPDIWPLILNMDSNRSIWARRGCVDHRKSETVEYACG